MGPQKLKGTLLELAWRLVDNITVQTQSGTTCMTSVPMLGPLPGYTSPNYSTWDTPSAASASAAITAQTAVPGTPLMCACVLSV